MQCSGIVLSYLFTKVVALPAPIMANKYDKSQQEVTKLSAILKLGESLPDHAESQSLATLVRTGFHTVMDIMKKQQEEFSTNCVNPNREISQDFKDEFTNIIKG